MGGWTVEGCRLVCQCDSAVRRIALLAPLIRCFVRTQSSGKLMRAGKTSRVSRLRSQRRGGDVGWQCDIRMRHTRLAQAHTRTRGSAAFRKCGKVRRRSSSQFSAVGQHIFSNFSSSATTCALMRICAGMPALRATTLVQTGLSTSYARL